MIEEFERHLRGTNLSENTDNILLCLPCGSLANGTTAVTKQQFERAQSLAD